MPGGNLLFRKQLKLPRRFDKLNMYLSMQTAVSDGLKRALRQFGHALGNCMAMQSYQTQMLQARNQQVVYSKPSPSAVQAAPRTIPTLPIPPKTGIPSNIPSFKKFQEQKLQQQQQTQAQQPKQVNAEFHPEEEYMQDLPFADDEVKEPQIANQYEFQDETNLSQPHPDEVPLNEEAALLQTNQVQQDEDYEVVSSGHNFPQGMEGII